MPTILTKSPSKTTVETHTFSQYLQIRVENGGKSHKDSPFDQNWMTKARDLLFALDRQNITTKQIETLISNLNVPSEKPQLYKIGKNKDIEIIGTVLQNHYVGIRHNGDTYSIGCFGGGGKLHGYGAQISKQKDGLYIIKIGIFYFDGFSQGVALKPSENNLGYTLTEGHFRSSQITKGQQFLSNGSTLIGDFINEKLHGTNCTIMGSDGTIIKSGEFKFGDYVAPPRTEVIRMSLNITENLMFRQKQLSTRDKAMDIINKLLQNLPQNYRSVRQHATLNLTNFIPSQDFICGKSWFESISIPPYQRNGQAWISTLINSLPNPIQNSSEGEIKRYYFDNMKNLDPFFIDGVKVQHTADSTLYVGIEHTPSRFSTGCYNEKGIPIGFGVHQYDDQDGMPKSVAAGWFGETGSYQLQGPGFKYIINNDGNQLIKGYFIPNYGLLIGENESPERKREGTFFKGELHGPNCSITRGGKLFLGNCTQGVITMTETPLIITPTRANNQPREIHLATSHATPTATLSQCVLFLVLAHLFYSIRNGL